MNLLSFSGLDENLGLDWGDSDFESSVTLNDKGYSKVTAVLSALRKKEWSSA